MPQLPNCAGPNGPPCDQSPPGDSRSQRPHSRSPHPPSPGRLVLWLKTFDLNLPLSSPIPLSLSFTSTIPCPRHRQALPLFKPRRSDEKRSRHPLFYYLRLSFRFARLRLSTPPGPVDLDRPRRVSLRPTVISPSHTSCCSTRSLIASPTGAPPSSVSSPALQPFYATLIF